MPSTSTLTAVLGLGLGLGFLAGRMMNLNSEGSGSELHSKCLKKNESERKGRIKAEKQLREKVFERISSKDCGFPLIVIGSCLSPFIGRRGTPRQGLLVPDSRAKIVLNKEIPIEALEGLETYSHLFIQFIFNENTNISKTLLASTTSLAKRSESSKSGSFSGKVSSFASRVLPPLLGKEIGLFATRSPHRPNALGLSLCRIERVDVVNRTITVSGADLVNGTLVVDLKPWGPFDCPRCIHEVVDHNGMDMRQCSDTTLPRCQAFTPTVPDWVMFNLEHPYKFPIEWSPKSLVEMEKLLEGGKSRFYTFKEKEVVKRAIEEMLSLDIRSIHRGKGDGPQTSGTATDLVGAQLASVEGEVEQKYEVDFDCFHISFLIKKGAAHNGSVWILVHDISFLPCDEE